MITAFVTRVIYFDGRDFWLDEIWRARIIVEPNFFYRIFISPTLYEAINPIGYLIVTKFFSVISLNVDFMRLTSLIPGILSPLIIYRILINNKANKNISFIAGLIVVLNSTLIDYSLELKPYMLELFVHTCYIYYILKILGSENFKYRNFVITTIFSMTFSSTLILYIPGVLVMLMSKKRFNKKFVIISFTAITIFYTIYTKLYLIHALNDQGLKEYWSNFFPREISTGSLYEFYLKSTLQLYYGTIDLSFIAIIVFSVILLILTTFSVIRKEFVIILIITGVYTFAVLIVINIIGIYPYGNMRTNLFLYIHIILLLVGLTNYKMKNLKYDLFGLFTILMLMTSFGGYAQSNKELIGAPIEDSKSVILDLINRIERTNNDYKIFVDSGIYNAIQYYKITDPIISRSLSGQEFKFREFSIINSNLNSGMNFRENRALFAYSHTSYDELTTIRSYNERIQFDLISKHRNSALYELRRSE